MLRLRYAPHYLVGLLCVMGCAGDAVQPTTAATGFAFSGSHPIRVVCTTGPVADLLRKLGGAHLEVTGLMGPGVDPHLYRAVPADIEHLARADMIFYNGLHLEGRMIEVFEKLAARKPTIAVTESLVAQKHPGLRMPLEFEGYYDPHVWHDPRLWSECVKYVAERLSEFDPSHRDDYIKNRDAYLGELEKIDQYAREQLGMIPSDQRVLVTAHDAFGYFCLAYELESMPLKGVSTEDEVTIGRMDEVVDMLRERNIKAVFVETATTPQIVRALIEPSRKKGHEVRIGGELYADALGPADSGADTYVGMFRANVETIVSALQ